MALKRTSFFRWKQASNSTAIPLNHGVAIEKLAKTPFQKMKKVVDKRFVIG